MLPDAMRKKSAASANTWKRNNNIWEKIELIILVHTHTPAIDRCNRNSTKSEWVCRRCIIETSVNREIDYFNSKRTYPNARNGNKNVNPLNIQLPKPSAKNEIWECSKQVTSNNMLIIPTVISIEWPCPSACNRRKHPLWYWYCMSCTNAI